MNTEEFRFWLPIIFPTITVALTAWRGVAWILVNHTTLTLGQAKLTDVVTDGHKHLETLILSNQKLLEERLSDAEQRIGRLEAWRDRQTT